MIRTGSEWVAAKGAAIFAGFLLVFAVSNSLDLLRTKAQCAPIPRLPNGSYGSWQKNLATPITIYINTAQITSPIAVKGITDAAQNFNTLSDLGVTFNVVQLNGPPAPTGRYIAVGTASLGLGRASTKFSFSPYTIQANTNFDPSNLTRDETYWADLMAHEMGHTFGLADCTNCQAGGSIMDLPADTSKPTNCDVQSINNYYKEYTPGSGSGGGAGCGQTTDTYEETDVTDTGDGCYCTTVYMVTDYYSCGVYEYTTRQPISYECDSC